MNRRPDTAVRRARHPESALLRHRRRRGRRGMALVMVLGALTILTVLLTEFQDETSAEFGSALSTRDGVKAEYAARSAINLSRLLIAAEPTIRKALAPLMMMATQQPPGQIPVWEFADQVLGAFNDQAGNEAFQALSNTKVEEGKNLGLPGAGFDVVIVDEDSKINLNSAWRDPLTQARLSAELLGLLQSSQYDSLFQRKDSEGKYSDRPTTCGAMIDWVDSDQDLNGCNPQAAAGPSAAAEDSYYQMLDVPYQRKNAPFDSLEELRLVRGVGDDFWATFVEADPDHPDKRNLTVWGQGKINVNTANAQIISALICGGTMPPATLCTDPAELMSFISLVSLIRGMMPGVPIFSSPKGFIATLKQQSPLGQMLKAMQLQPIQFFSEAETMKAITTESKVFSIYATGRVKAGKRETRSKVHAVVDFRGAPPVPMASAQMLAQLADMGMTGIPAVPQANLPPGVDATNAITGMFLPQPGGHIIYFRVD